MNQYGWQAYRSKTGMKHPGDQTENQKLMIPKVEISY